MSQKPSKVPPSAWVERLFEKLLAMYGEKFVRQWSVVDPEAMRRIWAEELADLTTAEVRRGVQACMGKEWPPTLPEFRNLCRQPLDYEAAFYEAARLFGVSAANWSSPAIYWAASSIGNDVRTLPYKAMVGRWKQALDYALAHKANEPVPVREVARIEDKGAELVPMPEAVRAQFANFMRKTTGAA